VSALLTIAVRWALYVDLMLLFGLPMFALYGLGRVQRHRHIMVPLRPLLPLLSVAAILLSLLWLATVCASMAGTDILQLDRATIDMVATQTSLGKAWQVRMAALAATLPLAMLQRRWANRPVLLATALAAGVALATLAWAGHGAAGDGTAGTIQLAADIVHLLAAGVWIGALVAFTLLLIWSHAISSRGNGPSEEHIATTHHALEKFSVTGSIVVGLLIATGVVNSVMLVGIANAPHLLASLYGQLLAAKLAVFGVMVLLAAGNRFRLTPALERARSAGNMDAPLAALRRSLLLETGAGLVVLGLVAWLGTLSPPLSGG
jgi:putative copper resistance protein D